MNIYIVYYCFFYVSVVSEHKKKHCTASYEWFYVSNFFFIL